MDFDPKHDQALDLPLRFPDDPIDEPPTPSQQSQQQQPPSSTSMRRQKSQDPQQQQQQSQKSPVPGPGPGPTPATQPPPPPQPTFTVYIRVPAPRNGFVDPPDVDWNKEKDDALWRILSRASKDDIDWEDLAQSFNATVGFLLIQATILTERHVSQVRAQTRKVATLGTANANANANTNATVTAVRDSPMNSPALTSEAMGRTLSSGGGTGSGPAGVRTGSAETMRRTASAGSRAPYRGGTSPSVGGGSRSGSRRPSMEDSQVRPTRPPVRPSLETISSFSPDKPIATTTPPVGGRGHPTFSPATAQQQQQQARLQSPLPIRPARPTDTVSRTNTFDSEGDEDEGEYGGEDEGGFEPESPAATSDSDSSSSSSTPSEPVMSRIFRRPPGHAPQQQQQKQQQQRQPSSRVPLSARQRGNNSTAQAAEGDFGVIGLGISSGGSDEGDADADGDGEESETQAAFLRFKSNTTKAQGSAAAANRQHPRHHHHNQQKRRSTADSSSSPSSSASVSPTTKAFKTPTVAAATAAAAGAGTASSASASAAAAARLQSSRKPLPNISAGGGGDIRSPPRLQNMSSAAATRSPAVRAATRGGGAGVPGISREGSEIGTTPSIGSSFSDLDDVSFTQSVLDEALGSKVEDTVVTPNPNSNNSGDPMSSSATRRR